MSTVVEINNLRHVILYKFQKMIQGGTPHPVLSFSRLWQVCSNASARMADLGVPNAVSDRKNFSRRFFEEINFLESAALCKKKEEENGTRRQLISVSLTDAGREHLATAIFANQQLAQEPEIIWNPSARRRYRGPII